MAGVSSQFGFSFHAGNREFHAKPQLISDGAPGEVKPGEVCRLHGKCCILKQLQRPRKDLVSILHPFPSPEDLSDPGTEPMSLTSPAFADGFFTASATWEAPMSHHPV